MPASKPTAATFFPAKSTADKAKIQSTIDRTATTDRKELVLAEATLLGRDMSGDERTQLLNIVYQQLDAR